MCDDGGSLEIDQLLLDPILNGAKQRKNGIRGMVAIFNSISQRGGGGGIQPSSQFFKML